MAVFHEKHMSVFHNYIIGGRCLFPGTGFVEMGLAAGGRMSHGGGGVHIAKSSHHSSLCLRRVILQSSSEQLEVKV
jgi:hypothetical protein